MAKKKASKVKAKRSKKPSEVAASIIAGLTEFRDVLASEVPLEDRYTARRRTKPPAPKTYHPADVKAVRESFGVSQAALGMVIGVSPSTVRAWEQGQKKPSPIACRFLDEMQATPDHWRGRIRTIFGEA